MKASRNLLSIILIILLVMSFTVMALAQGTEVAPTGPGDRVVAQSPASPPVSVKFLTQNTALLPGWPVKLVGLCVDKTQRIPCIRDLIGSYDIVGLQEIFDEYCQYIIVNSWPGKREVMIDLEAEQQNILEKREPVMTLNYLKGASVVGRIIDARPNTIESYIVYDRYFVMGPDSDLTANLPLLNWFKVKRQDGGLLILTKKDYPIIAASGFVFKDTAEPKLKSWDALSNKGVLYARIQVGPSEEDYIHVFNTHLQAHLYPEACKVRKKQLKELEEFIRNATSDRWFFSSGKPVPEPSSSMGKYDGHPIVLMGDFNIIASSTPGKPQKKTPEYTDLLNALPQLLDAWDEKNPSQEGHTWIGMDQRTPPNSPWWVLGNVVAIEKDGGQRIDYFFYNAGAGKLVINPTSVSLVPPGPQTAYCFDYKSADWWGCIKAIVPQSKADIKVGEIHALVIDSLMVGAFDKVEGIAQLGAFKIYIDPAWETPKFKIGDLVLAKIFAMTAIDTAVAREYKVKWMKKRCTLISHTVSDHLGVEMIAKVTSPIVVTFWTHEVGERQLEIQNALAEQFMAQFPDIEVKVVPVNRGEYLSRISLTLAAGLPLPDVMYLPMDFSFVLANQDVEIFDTTAAAEVMSELGIDSCEVLVPTIPADSWKLLLLYRKDLFDAHGLAVPDSWDSILNAAYTLHNPPELWGIEVATDPNQPYMAQVFNWFALSNGALPLDEYGEINLETPEFIEAMHFYGELASFTLPENVGWERARSDYLEGRAAMIIWPSSILDELAGLRASVPVADTELFAKTGFVSGIAGPNGAAEYNFVNCFGITADADTEAAKAWVWYLLSEGYLQWLSMAPERKLPFWKGTAAHQDAFLEEWGWLEFGVDYREPIFSFYSYNTIRAILDGVEGFAFDRWPFEAWGLPGDGMGAINTNLMSFLFGERTAEGAAFLITEQLREAIAKASLSKHWCPCVVLKGTTYKECVQRIYDDCIWASKSDDWLTRKFCNLMAKVHCLCCCCYLGGGRAR